ncbi:hypothetical protein F2Q70_00018571 [Brassica cretica]|uniref:Uncharacterized protein n=1 Tax=Brassica cretica TaxID=69181 RepID=A0A8S9HWN1_BRACR|nr:hypothetical protein F2Q70_00018571 [Brassica cretica]
MSSCLSVIPMSPEKMIQRGSGRWTLHIAFDASTPSRLNDFCIIKVRFLFQYVFGDVDEYGHCDDLDFQFYLKILLLKIWIDAREMESMQWNLCMSQLSDGDIIDIANIVEIAAINMMRDERTEVILDLRLPSRSPLSEEAAGMDSSEIPMDPPPENRLKEKSWVAAAKKKQIMTKYEVDLTILDVKRTVEVSALVAGDLDARASPIDGFVASDDELVFECDPHVAGEDDPERLWLYHMYYFFSLSCEFFGLEDLKPGEFRKVDASHRL